MSRIVGRRSRHPDPAQASLEVIVLSISGFVPHEYGCSRFNNYLGPQHNWENDLAPAFLNKDFVVVIHGVVAAGKSSLIKLLCGHQNGLQIGQKLPDGSNIQSLTDRADIYNCRSRTNPHSANIFVIDTPGFGEPSEAGQLRALEGVDRAHQFAREQRAPLKRIYFLLDWTDPKEAVPNNLESHLRILLARYGPSIGSRVRFVVSKSDLLMKDNKDKAKERLDRILECFKWVFDPEPHSKTVLFISVTSNGNARQLSHDLTIASNDRACEGDLQPTLFSGVNSPHLKTYKVMYKLLGSLIKEYSFENFLSAIEWEPTRVLWLQSSTRSLQDLASRISQLLREYQMTFEKSQRTSLSLQVSLSV